MGINVLDTLKQYLTPELMGKLAQFLDEDSVAVQNASNIVLPTLMSGIINQTTQPKGESALYDTFTNKQHDGNILSYLPILFGGGSATQGLLNMGAPIISTLFGQKLAGISEWIATKTGIKTATADSLLRLLAPVVMGVIGRKVQGSAVNLSDVTPLLDDQKPAVRAELPTELASILGFTSFMPDVRRLTKEDNLAGLPPLSKILPWLLLLVAGILSLMYLKMCNTTPPTPSVQLMDTPPLLDTVKTIQLPEGELTVKKGSFIDSLSTAINDTTSKEKPITFDNINFATASAELTTNSYQQLDDMVKILKAYPNVEIKIVGHTDNIGNDAYNQKLSINRALAVKNYLQSKGIAAKRIATEGYGATKPLSSNEDESGRALNRRIEAFVVRK